MSVQFGIDGLLDQERGRIANRRVGLISNASAVTGDLISTLEALHCASDVELVALFGPEHGFSALAADGALVRSTTDARTGLPIYSLFDESKSPTEEMLTRGQGIDLLIFDMQTVGVRFYTYITTLLYVMQAAAEHRLPIIVCDRPNPIGGQILEGPLLEPGLESFVGPGPLPIRYGLTIGELARLFNDGWGVACDLTVVPCHGWKRGMWYEDTRLPWVSPSPAMPWPATTVVYPGTCLVEGTNLSEGRGTALPFHLVGAPWIDGHRLAKELHTLDLPGVRFRPTLFQPVTHKWAGEPCGGVQLHVTDRVSFRPVSASLHLLATVKSLYPQHLEFRANDRDSRRHYIDLLAGTERVRRALEESLPVTELVSSWAEELKGYERNSRAYRCYN